MAWRDRFSFILFFSRLTTPDAVKLQAASNARRATRRSPSPRCRRNCRPNGSMLVHCPKKCAITQRANSSTRWTRTKLYRSIETDFGRRRTNHVQYSDDPDSRCSSCKTLHTEITILFPKYSTFLEKFIDRTKCRFSELKNNWIYQQPPRSMLQQSVSDWDFVREEERVREIEMMRVGIPIGTAALF